MKLECVAFTEKVAFCFKVIEIPYINDKNERAEDREE